MGADGRRSASGGGACGSKKTKGRGISFSPHIEASAGERAAGKSTAAEIDAGSRKLRTMAAGSVGAVRDPKELN
jgi:hypothetical protein